MKVHLLVDGMLSGTGLRDAVRGGYVEPEAIGVSADVAAALAAWQQGYEDAHFAEFPKAIVADLDRQGLILRDRVQQQLSGKIVGYFSNGRMERLA